jgi:hypothetical protein
MNFLTIFVSFGLIGAVLSGGSSLCEPFLSNFRAFDQAMLITLDNLLLQANSELKKFSKFFLELNPRVWG